MMTLGWLTRPAAIIIACTMAYISFFVGNGIVWYNDQHPFMFVLLALLFLFTGPGKYSVDAILEKKLR
jgi:putative oxidoreductase